MSDFSPIEIEPERSPIAPPAGGDERVKWFIWNPHELRAGYRLVLYVVLVAILMMGFSRLSAALRLPVLSTSEITPEAALVQETISLLSALGGAAVLARLEGRSLGVYGLPVSAAFKKNFGVGLAWGLAMISAIMLLIRVFGGISFGGLALSGAGIFSYALIWAGVFLVVGFFEEFLFRGYTLFTLSSGVGFWPAAAILSAIFGAGHLVNGGEGRVGALSVFVVGMFLSLTVRRTGNLWLAVGLHAAFDWGETYLYSVPDSGLVAPGHLLNTTFHGPVWITGGTVGPEGSAAAFVIMGLAAVIFARVYPAREESWHAPQPQDSSQLL